MLRSPLLPGLALFLLVPFASADTITKTDGTVIADVTIESESLTAVTYKEGRASNSVPADEVRSVTYSRMPKEVDEAVAALAEGDLVTGVNLLEGYVAGNSSDNRFKWAPAFASKRALEARMQAGDFGGSAQAAKRLIEAYPNSRYVPQAYLTKAHAESWSGNDEAARTTLESMAAFINTNGLSKRWDLLCRLARVQTEGSKPGDAQRGELGVIASEAGTAFPGVRSLARVAEGESYLSEAEVTRDNAKARELREKGQRVFEEIVGDPASEDTALAGAYTGLGDCLFFAGAASDNAEMLDRAAKNYLRVIINHEEEGHYVPKALFYAMRCFQLAKNGPRASDMRRELLSQYPDSTWAQRNEVK